jgi:hypothetical protein
VRPARWALAAMVAAAVVAGGLANLVDARLLASGREVVVRGVEAEDVVVGNIQLHVHGATASPQLDDGGEVFTSPGTFVAVDLSYATTDAWGSPEEILLVDGQGRQFSTPGGFSSPGDAWVAGPDIWLRGQLLFEVPPDALDTLRLQVVPDDSEAVLPATTGLIPLTVTTAEEPLALDYPELLAEGER